MYNYARNADVYQIYADVVSGHDTGAARQATQDPARCVYASRRDHRDYQLSSDRLAEIYGDAIVAHQRNLELLFRRWATSTTLLRTTDAGRATAFIDDVLRRHERRPNGKAMQVHERRHSSPACRRQPQGERHRFRPADHRQAHRWTSHQVVGRVRRVFGTRKVGHAGTLDPMATGVLIVGSTGPPGCLGHLALHDKA